MQSTKWPLDFSKIFPRNTLRGCSAKATRLLRHGAPVILSDPRALRLFVIQIRRQSLNRVRIGTIYRGWEDVQNILTYGWLKRGDEPPRLVPQTFLTEARYKKHIQWCRGQFTNYQIFDSRVRIVANDR